MPGTRWATEIRWPARPQATPGPGTADTLLQLLRRDIERGHVHLAMRHLLMLEACAADVPGPLRLRCEALFSTCKASRRNAIARQVEDWARMTLRWRWSSVHPDVRCLDDLPVQG
jgi:hypothetical protein